MLALMNMVAPISALVLPAAASRATVGSCAVRPEPGPADSTDVARSPVASSSGAGPCGERPAPLCVEHLDGDAGAARARRGAACAAAATRRRGGVPGRGRPRRRRRSARRSRRWKWASASRPVHQRAGPAATPAAHAEPLASRHARRAVATVRLPPRVAAAHRGLDEVRVLQRGDLEERVVDQRLEPVVGVRGSGPRRGRGPRGRRLPDGLDPAEPSRIGASASAPTWSAGRRSRPGARR